MGFFSWLFSSHKNKKEENFVDTNGHDLGGNEKRKIGDSSKQKINLKLGEKKHKKAVRKKETYKDDVFIIDGSHNKQKINYKNSGKNRTEKEDNLLKHLYLDDGYSLISLSKRFGRNVPGIVARISKLGLVRGGSDIKNLSEELKEPSKEGIGNNREIPQFREKEKQPEKDYGFNENGIHKITGTQWDENGFDSNGINIDTGTSYSFYHFDRDGLNEYTGTKYDEDGYDVDGYDLDGFDRSGDKRPNGAEMQLNTLEPQIFHEEELFNLNQITDSDNQFINENDLDQNIIAILKDELNFDIYSTKYVESILSKYNIGDKKYERIMIMLGFVIKKGYIVKKEYKNFNRYLASKIKNGEIIHIDKDIVNANYNFVADFCRNYELFKVNDELYISWVKMDEIGINSEYIKKFLRNVKIAFNNWTFFSIKNIKNIVDIGLFKELGFEDSFIENIVFYSKDIETLRINNNKLFSYEMKNLTITGFIEEILLKYRVLSIYDFMDLVNDKYGLDLDYDIVKYYVYNIVKNYKKGLSDIYYDSTLEKLYIDKEDFYNELSEDDEN